MANFRIAAVVAAVAGLTVLSATPGYASARTHPRPPEVSSPRPVPAKGAYVGASVYYDHSLQTPKVGQISVLEGDLGRKLDIDNSYYCFDNMATCDIVKNSAAQSDAQNGRMPLDSWSCSQKQYFTLKDIITGFQAWEKNHSNQSAAVKYIVTQAQEVAAYGTTTFIRWAWEMTSPGGGANSDCVAKDGGPSAYTGAWQAIYTLFHAYGASNAQFVWCPGNQGFKSNDGNPLHSVADSYYPGNAYVDYVCADGYNRTGETLDFAALFNSAYKFATTVSSPAKPFMVGETGDEAADPNQPTWISSKMFGEVQSSYPDVKAVLYWDSYVCPSSTNPGNDYTVGWSNLTTVPPSVAALQSVVRNPYFNPRNLPITTPTPQKMIDAYSTC